MKVPHIKNPTLQFALPVIFETVASTLINLIFSSLIGGISGSSLTVISQSNTIISLITASLTMLTTGSSVLCARLLGAHDQREASRVAEQTLLLSGVFSIVIMILCLIFTVPLLSLLMPNAEPAVLAEGVVYFRVLILSLPFLMLTSVLVSMQRASGDSRTAMLINVITGILQLGFAFLFLRVFMPGVAGAGLTNLLCRICSMMLAIWAVLRSHRFALKLRRIFIPHFPTFKRIFHIGLPASFEAVFVQAGYLIAGSMVIGLGTFEAAAYNVANTLYSFAGLPQTIFSAITLATTGHLLGAKEYAKAHRNGWKLWGMAVMSVLILGGILIALRSRLTPLYSDAPAVQAAAASAIFFALLMVIPGVSLNTLIPQLQAGGAVKIVMIITLFGVWIIRLPLTYLFCYHWTLGAKGVFLANAISMYVRLLCTTICFVRGKYLYMRV
ncbi:MAG: MATE family efflux transporter [Clostridia bacterium]|nr:MATE family efflux transporter [Clostridia bacterium]